jgi:hypothetical protein
LGTISAFAIRHRETKKKTCAEMAHKHTDTLPSDYTVLTAQNVVVFVDKFKYLYFEV